MKKALSSDDDVFRYVESDFSGLADFDAESVFSERRRMRYVRRKRTFFPDFHSEMKKALSSDDDVFRYVESDFSGLADFDAESVFSERRRMRYAE